MTFETLFSEVAYTGRVFDVRRDQVKLPDGQTTQLDIVAHGGAVVILPIDQQGQVWFVRQYRHATGETLLELPAGALEAGEDPTQCAQRELREEIGMQAGTLKKLGGFFLAPGYSTEFIHLFLATELEAAPLPGDIDEFLTVEPHRLSAVFGMIGTNAFLDAKTLAGLLLAYPVLTSWNGEAPAP